MNLPPWVSELCSMLQIAENAAIVLQMQQHEFFGVGNLIYHSYEVNWVLLPKIHAIPRINKETSWYAAISTIMLQICSSMQQNRAFWPKHSLLPCFSSKITPLCKKLWTYPLGFQNCAVCCKSPKMLHMLQMQQYDFFGACNLFHHSF